MGLFDRSPSSRPTWSAWLPGWLSSGGRHAAAARKAELRGDLARAAELWGAAGCPADVVRVMLLRGDGEVDPARRLPHYAQAVGVARSLGRPLDASGKAALEAAIRKHGGLVIALAASTPAGGLSAARKRELLEVGQALEDVGAPEQAAEAYRLAQDRDAEARALTQAGNIEELEALLARDEKDVRAARRTSESRAEIDLLAASGRRREALARAEALAREQPGDQAIEERAAGMRARRVADASVRIAVAGPAGRRELAVLLGASIVIGRTEGDICVPSHAVSRRHVEIGRADGRIVLRDLGSRNGTQLRGMAVSGPLPVEGELVVTLGKEVRLAVTPNEDLAGAVTVEVAGARHVAPLGPLRLPIAGWRLERGDDGWLELVTEGSVAYLGDVELTPRATLLVGDKLATSRGGSPAVEIVG